MIEIGCYNTLEIHKFTPQGAYLTDGNESVLLPIKYLDSNWKEGEELKVFIYLDSEDRMVATTETPHMQRDEFACLEVIQTTPFGAFMDWGLSKDILVPLAEQFQDMRVGEKHLVYLYFDYESQRLVASAKIHDFTEEPDEDISEKEEVDIVVWRQTDLGYQALIKGKYLGMIYDNEIYQPIRLNQHMKAYVQTIRPDGKIDLRLQRSGYVTIDENAKKILQILSENKGFLPFTDKSDPDEIKHFFEMSKKNFKKGIGNLYKQGKIRLDDDGIYEISED